MFFPAVTGIDAGVGMSGDLKHAKKSLVKGTFFAIIITFFVYLFSAFIYTLIQPELIVTGYDIDGIPTGNLLTNLLGFGKPFPYNIPGVMVMLGILVATSSSALSCFMTAPRTLQSLSNDNTLPGFLNFVSKDFIKDSNEPRFATLVTFIFGVSVIWIGNIDIASMIVGICFLVVYGWINLSAFLERISNNPTFRPTSKGSLYVSLYGFLSSLLAVCLFSLKVGLIIIISQMVIFQLILKYKSENKIEGVWWGVMFSLSTKMLTKLRNMVQGSKNWRPVLSAIGFYDQSNDPSKIDYIAERIAAYQGLVNMNIINLTKETPQIDLKLFKVPVKIIETTEPTQSILSIIQASNTSGIESNTILLNYSKKINSVEIIKKILALNKNVIFLKNAEKLNDHKVIDIWWRGEKNGNFMVLLAYIINNNPELKNRSEYKIRIIRQVNEEANQTFVEAELQNLLDKARLVGEVFIIPYTNRPFLETLSEVSKNTDLIMMGLPGIIKSEGITKLFNLNEVFFSQEIEKYNDLPAILFIKSSGWMNLIDE